MKAVDVITQLQAMLPTFTDKFSTNIGIISITSVGNIATLTTDVLHNLSVGNVVNVVGSQSPVNITSLSRAETIVTVTTAQDHDLTEGVFSTVTIVDTSEAIFNGTFPFLTQVNRRTFTFQVADSGATNAVGGQLASPGTVGGYNGLVTILTVPTTTSFTYTTAFIQPNAAILALGEVRQALRITGAIDVERAEEMYSSPETSDDFWAFVLLNGSSASKDRHGQNDAINSAGPSGSRRQQVMQTCTIAVFSKTENDLSGREARDNMEDLNPAIFGSLIGAKISSGLAEGTNLGLNYIDSDVIKYVGPYLIFGWTFQLLATINNEDTIKHGLDVAFRDISLSMSTNLGTEILTAAIDLDDQPF